MMTPRERVAAALAHKEPDRIPIDLGGTLVSSITKAAYVPLREHLGLPAEDIVIFEQTQQLPYLSEDLLERFAVDTRVVALPRERALRPELVDEGNYWAWTDMWGAKLRMPKESGLYYDWVKYPLPEVTADAVDEYRWPEFETAENLAAIRDAAIGLRRDTDFALVGTANIGGGIFEQACRMAGMESFMMAMVTDRRAAERLLDGITDFYVEVAQHHLDQVEMVLGNLIKPRQRRL